MNDEGASQLPTREASGFRSFSLCGIQVLFPT
jgi:hypothetical protein